MQPARKTTTKASIKRKPEPAKKTPRATPKATRAQPDGKTYLNAEQASDLLGISATTIKAAVRSGDLAGRDFGGSAGVRTTRDALQAWIEGTTIKVEEPEPAAPPEALKASSDEAVETPAETTTEGAS